MAEALIAAAPKLTLPTSRSAPSRKWIDQRFVVIGQAGVGKSTLFSNGEKTFFIDTEGSLGHLSVMSVRVQSFNEFRDVYMALYDAAQKGVYPYDTVVVDTADQWLAQAEQDVIAFARTKFKNVAADSMKTIGDVPEGVGWSRTSNLVMTALDNLDKLPSATVLITHPKSAKIKEASGSEYDKETVALWGQIGVKVLSWSHHNLHIRSTLSTGVLKRLVKTLPQREIEAKSHGSAVPDNWELKTRDLAAEYRELRANFTD